MPQAKLIYTKKQLEGLKILNNMEIDNILFDGGGRSGKTELFFDRIFYRAWMYPKSEHIILRKNVNHCYLSIYKKTMMDYLQRYIDPYVPKAYVLNKEDLTCTLRNGSVIMCDGCDDSKRVRKIFGREYATMWFNEATEFQWAVIDDLMSRLVQKVSVDPRCKGQRDYLPDEINVQAWFDANPKGPRHYLYKVGVQHVDPETGERMDDAHTWGRLGGWTPMDNAQHLSKKAISRYEAMTGVRRERMLKGKWCSNDGAVYDEWDEDVHVCKRCTAKEKPERCPRLWNDKNEWRARGNYRGIDFGFRDPFVCLWVARLQEGLLLHRCYYKRKVIVSKHAERIKYLHLPNEPITWTVADHDAEDAATLRSEHVYSRPAHKDRPTMAGVDRVKRRLEVNNGRPGLEVCQYCTEAIDEFDSYCMDKNSEKDAPEDGNDHCMDTIRYIVAGIDRRRASMAVPL